MRGWTRRHVIADVGYQARTLALVVASARSGLLDPLHGKNEHLTDVADGATLPDRALRGLFDHAAVHLDTEWRDLTAAQWRATISGPEGADIDVAATPWLRAERLWLRAVDLDNGGSFLDFPPGVLDRLLSERARLWKGPAMELRPNDRSTTIAAGGTGGAVVSGRAADIARWITGRGERRLAHEAPLPHPKNNI